MTKTLSITTLLFICCALSIVAALSQGAIAIDFHDVIGSLIPALASGPIDPIITKIVSELRLPRILLALLSGAGLAIAGATLQQVTRNPLADPFLFGISAGASFGAVIVLTTLTNLAILWLPIGAFVGGLLSVAMVLFIAGRSSYQQIERMLLAGVASSFMFSAATSAILYQSDPQAAASILFWTLGSFSQAQWDQLLWPTLVIGLSIIVFFAYSRQVLAISGGDENATTLGVSVSKVRLLMLVLSSLICAVIVANAGGIAFVGLLIPHVVRLTLGQRMLNNYFIIALLGATFMILVDLAARTLIPNQEVPLGIITSAIGSIFFLFILKQRRQY